MVFDPGGGVAMNVTHCENCIELIQYDGRQYFHIHTGETYCYTGDGATAYPAVSR